MKCFKIEDGYVVNVAIFKEVPDGWVEAKENHGIGSKCNGDGTFSIESANNNKLSDKEIRDIDLKNITHDFGDGRVIQLASKDLENIQTALHILELNNESSVDWLMIDNKVYNITKDELIFALEESKKKSFEIWKKYIDSKKS